MLPFSANKIIRDEKQIKNISHCQVGWREQGKRMSRANAAAVASRVNLPDLMTLAVSDLLWDSIVEISMVSVEKVFDVTVADEHNFAVDDFMTHNSGEWEQSADVVVMIYRDEVYDEKSPDKGCAEILVRKQRSGPLGMVPLAFRGEFSRFDNLIGGLPSWSAPAPAKVGNSRGIDF